MSVWHNCYVFNSSDNSLIIETGKNRQYVRKNKKDLQYTFKGNGKLVSLKDKEGNYYYLSETHQEIQ